MEMIKELLVFMRSRKKYWLWPILGMMLFLGALIVLGQSSGLLPLIYTLF